MVGFFGCWGCAVGAAGLGASTQLTYRIAQFDANWIALGVALWSLVLIMGSEAAFMWEFQAWWRSATTFFAGLTTLYYLYKSVSLGVLLNRPTIGAVTFGAALLSGDTCVLTASTPLC